MSIGFVDFRAAPWVSLLAVVVAAGAPRPVNAAALSWNNAVGGAAATSGNWTPAQVPASADDLTFNVTSVYTVTWNSLVTASRTHTLKRGTVTYSLSSPHTAGLGIIVGDQGTDSSTLTVTTGTLRSDASMTVANATGSSGTLNVDDDDAELIVGNGADLTIGNNGTGQLNVTNEALVEVADQLMVGSNAVSSANVTVSGASFISPTTFRRSRLRVLGANDSRIGLGGDVTLNVSNGALASFASRLIVANGSASVSSVTVATSSSIFSAQLDVGGELFLGRNVSTGVIAGSGTLVINTGGLVNVTGATRLGDPDGGSGTITMGGGAFVGGQPIEVLAGSTIEGTGTISADISNNGAIAPQGALGLALNGVLSNATHNVVGTRIAFGSTGGYTGAGSCQTDIAGDVGAVITATGPLSLGRNTTGGVNYNGDLHVGTHAVTLVDSNGAVLGGETIIDTGGQLSCVGGIGVASGGRLTGRGTVTSNVVMSGALDPQRSPTPGGIMAISGNLVMSPSGSFEMEIGGPPASASHDRANVTGTASFDGVIRVTIPNGYVPRVGEQFIAINATLGRTGEFASVVPPDPVPCNGVTFVDVYSSTAAIVLVRPPLGCTALGDLNSDGRCNGPDIQPFVNALVTGPYNHCADMNGDCQNTAADIAIFLNCLL